MLTENNSLGNMENIGVYMRFCVLFPAEICEWEISRFMGDILIQQFCQFLCILRPAGLHLEIDPRGGKMSIYEKEGGRSPVYMRG